METSGTQALLTLAYGDMRRALNLLQSTASAQTVINESSVYQTAGTPLPRDVRHILETLLNEEYTQSYKRMSHLTPFF